MRAHYSCADCLTHPLPRKSSPARQRLTLRKAVSRETKPFSSHRTIRRTGQDGRHSHHPSALPQGRGSATHCLRTQLFTSRTPPVCRLPQSFTSVLVPVTPSRPLFHVKLRLILSTPAWTAYRHRMSQWIQKWGQGIFGLGPTVVFTSDEVYSSSRDVPGANAPTIRARSSSPANSIVIRPFFAPRVTLTRVSKASERRVESAGRGVLRARSTFG